ncbi:MAG: hypothetical protein F4X11_15775 [Acidobacteria bacterium]|nr:hypothetical protein [Acidobacteriota bacterium]
MLAAVRGRPQLHAGRDRRRGPLAGRSAGRRRRSACREGVERRGRRWIPMIAERCGRRWIPMIAERCALARRSAAAGAVARRGATAGAVLLALAFLAVGRPAAQHQVLPGDPLPGLTPVEFEEFMLGLDDFLEVEDAEEGLGPAYNNTSCAGCHNVPAIGGIAPMTTTRAGIREPDGTYRDVEPGRGSLFQIFSIPTHACQSVIPPEANVIAKRVPIPLFGAGLIEAIPDAALEALADADDLDRDGVSGRAPIVVDLATGEPRVGRFGWKSQRATLLDFGADAYRNEMGITNDLFPAELTFRLSARQLALCDEAPDPEDIVDPPTGRRGIDNFESFMRLLAPPARGPRSPLTALGREVFDAIGCAACHVPVLATGPSANPLFDRQPVALFSDLLLHDVGTGDGIRQASAEPDEMRTPPLWGLRFRRPLLHDGSAATAVEAIRRHGNEAALAREGFERLAPADRAALAAFLDSL